jgi:(S)-ureidoglycine aminohydrolase
MKTVVLSLLTLLITTCLVAQNDSLPSGVYNWSNVKAEKNKTGEKKDILKGTTFDLSGLQIHTSTLLPGITNHPPVVYNDVEELVIVKEGNLTLTINDTSKILGEGGLGLIVAGDKQNCTNNSGKPVTYYVLSFHAKDAVNIQRGKIGGGSLMKDWSELAMKKTDRGESRPIFDRPSSMFVRFDVHATALNAGFDSHLPHTHRAEEIILLTKGNGEIQIGQTLHKVSEGDVVFLEANVLHAFKNTSKQQCGYYAIQWHTN